MGRLAVVVSVMLVAGCTTAQPPHHLGIHLSGDLGGATSRSGTETGGGEGASVSGAGAAFGLAAGHSTIPDLVLGAQIWGVAAPRPRIRTPARGYWIDGSRDFTYRIIAVGPLVKYYVMPANVYVAVAPSVTWLTLSRGHGDRRTLAYRANPGLGLRAAIGKEWCTPLGGWTLGIGGVFHFASNEDNTFDSFARVGPWRTLGGGVALTASKR